MPIPPAPASALDALIVGHGLAGAVLAHVLHRAGWRVLVIDAPQPDSASRVAAGLVNPLAGRRFALTWRAQELLPAAAAFYQSVEQELGIRCWHARPILKFFSTVAEANTGAGKADGSVPFVEELLAPFTADPVRAPLGGLRLSGGGFLLTETLLDALTAERRRLGQWRTGAFEPARLTMGPAGSHYALAEGSPVTARWVIFCEGVAVRHNPWFKWLPVTPNTGEVLDVQLPTPAQGGPPDDVVYNGGAYVVPHGGGHFRVGATYDWRLTPPEPTQAARAELLGRLAQVVPLPARLLAQRAAQRPAVRDRRPLLGIHPLYPGLAVFNGFGSKGVGMAPRLAEHLRAVLAAEEPLWPDVAIERYWGSEKGV